jgi:hypothetical protein
MDRQDVVLHLLVPRPLHRELRILAARRETTLRKLIRDLAEHAVRAARDDAERGA